MKLFYCINYLLTITQHETFTKFNSALAAFNLTPSQYDVLNCIWSSQNGSLTPSELSQILRLDNSTISGILDKMQKSGFVNRLLDPNNKRNILVQATDKSLAIREDILVLAQELNNDILCNFSKIKKKELITLLRKLAQIQ